MPSTAGCMSTISNIRPSEHVSSILYWTNENAVLVLAGSGLFSWGGQFCGVKWRQVKISTVGIILFSVYFSMSEPRCRLPACAPALPDRVVVAGLPDEGQTPNCQSSLSAKCVWRDAWVSGSHVLCASRHLVWGSQCMGYWGTCKFMENHVTNVILPCWIGTGTCYKYIHVKIVFCL